MDSKQMVKVAAGVSLAASERYDATLVARLGQHGINASSPEALGYVHKIAGAIHGAREIIDNAVTPEAQLDILKSAAETAETSLEELKTVANDTDEPKIPEAAAALDAPTKPEGDEKAT